MRDCNAQYLRPVGMELIGVLGMDSDNIQSTRYLIRRISV